MFDGIIHFKELEVIFLHLLYQILSHLTAFNTLITFK